MIQAADLFCGAGGTSTGLVRACRSRGLELQLVAVNHWPVAVETHRRNHPFAEHICADLSSVDPNRAVPSGRLDILVASPECTHHSNARGGRPCSNQSRASAWHVLHWVERLQVRAVLIENVREFESWGPLTKKGRPVKRHRGETFKAFLRALESLGYRVEYRILNAADYGDATTRKRLFIQARRGCAPVWPEGQYVGRWRAAREIIDWELKGTSISERKRPLSPRTLDRIAAGLRRFGGEPFLAVLRGTGTVRDVSAPLPTATAGGNHLGLCEPFIVAYHAGDRAERIHSVGEPLPTQDTQNRFALAQPVVVRVNRSENSGECLQDVASPLPTLTTHNGLGVVEPYLVKYFKTGGTVPVSEPLDTITTKPRFGLVQPVAGRYGLDIRFRMLQPHELAAAMSFDGYEFSGTKEQQVKQIGNAVPVRTAEALCGAILGDAE